MLTPQPFQIDTIIDRDIGVISVSGEVDLASAPELRAAFEEAQASDLRRIMLALSGVTFMDSTGVGLLLEFAATSRANGNRLRILTSPAVDDVLEICGLHDCLPLAA